MKYSEAHSKWIYDWPTIIDDLEAGLYDKKTTMECLDAVVSWPTCACGNQCASLPRDVNGKPSDSHLEVLGDRFATYVNGIIGARGQDRTDMATGAREVMADIDARSAVLLAEMKKAKG